MTKQLEIGDCLYQWHSWNKEFHQWIVISVTPKRAILQLASQKQEVKRQSTSNIFTSINQKKESFVYGCQEMQDKYEKQELVRTLIAYDYTQLSLFALRVVLETVKELGGKN